MSVQLNTFKLEPYSFERNFLIRSLWHFINTLIMKNPLVVFGCVRKMALSIFGAKLGKGLVLGKAFSVKCPWFLEVGDYCWIGEDVWIDNLALVKIGSNVCISQGAYLCTGNHDWSRKDFPMKVEGICIEDGVWVGAKSIVGPGSVLGRDCVLSLGVVFSGKSETATIYFNSVDQLSTRKRNFV